LEAALFVGVRRQNRLGSLLLTTAARETQVRLLAPLDAMFADAAAEAIAPRAKRG
jgi:hypothetical protein